MSRVYIAGPMTDLENFNRQAFFLLRPNCLMMGISS